MPTPNIPTAAIGIFPNDAITATEIPMTSKPSITILGLARAWASLLMTMVQRIIPTPINELTAPVIDALLSVVGPGQDTSLVAVEPLLTIGLVALAGRLRGSRVGQRLLAACIDEGLLRRAAPAVASA